MRFALFFLAEYANMIVVSVGRDDAVPWRVAAAVPERRGAGVPRLRPSWTWFLIKSFLFLYFFVWIRATLPRYRYDQLMRLGWKVLIRWRSQSRGDRHREGVDL
jgi:NADH-quinone oxidoreductase subunit H